jgi:hypothetical protein
VDLKELTRILDEFSTEEHMDFEACQGLIPGDTSVSWSFQWNAPGVRATSSDALIAAIRALFGG